jgi:hypothetical protein
VLKELPFPQPVVAKVQPVAEFAKTLSPRKIGVAVAQESHPPPPPPPPPPHTPHWATAAFAQIESHELSQQNGSWPQIRLQHSASEHAGVPFATQQSPAAGSPHCAIALLETNAVAVAVQIKVHFKERILGVSFF